MTTLTPEKEAELSLVSLKSALDHAVFMERSYDYFQVGDVTNLLATLSTERQAREAADLSVREWTTRAQQREIEADAYAKRAWAAEAKLAALVKAAQLTLDTVVEHGYGTADCHLILHHTAYHALEDALSAPPPPEERGPQLIARYHVPSDVASRPDAYVDVPAQAPQDVAGLVEEDDGDRRGLFVASYGHSEEAVADALRASPISHEDRPLVLAAADNNHKALVEALAEPLAAWAEADAARCAAVEAYNARLAFVNAQRDRGDWSERTEPEYHIMDETAYLTRVAIQAMSEARQALAAAQPTQQAASAAATNEASDQSRQEGKQP